MTILDYTKNTDETFRTISDDLSESLKNPELYAQKHKARSDLINVFNTSTEENLASSIEIQGIPLDQSQMANVEIYKALIKQL